MIREERTTTRLIVSLPSGDCLRIDMPPSMPPDDKAFIERIMQIAEDEQEKDRANGQS